MNSVPLLLDEYPKAILHVDGDAFFASVEQALTPELRGKPVVTGRERGIIACASYEAKAAGVRRGLMLSEARRLCPELVILPDDYETYCLYSKRLFDILRRYTPIVEEASIDEAFADLTGVRRLFHCSYEEIARRLQKEIHRELGITVSMGLSCSKALAKLCSKFRKPAGWTAVPGPQIHHLLRQTPLDAVWGFGPNTVALLRKQGLETAYDYVGRPESWASRWLGKRGREIWQELRGHSVWEVTTEERSAQVTITKSKTFTPPTGDRDYVYARLIWNLEEALSKARRHRLCPRTLAVVLRHQDFRHDGVEVELNRPTACPLALTPLVRTLFEEIFRRGSLYRSTLVVLAKLQPDLGDQRELFEDPLRIDRLRRLTAGVDEINRRFGQHTVGLATALDLARKPSSDRDEAPSRQERLGLPSLLRRRHLSIPRWRVPV